jgi:hypothetical protein
LAESLKSESSKHTNPTGVPKPAHQAL